MQRGGVLASLALLATIVCACTMMPQEEASSVASHTVELAPPTQAELASLRGGSKDRPLAVGFGREIPADRQRVPLDQLRWRRTGDKGFIATIAVRSAEAKSLRVGLRMEAPPAGLTVAFKENGAEIAVPAALIAAGSPEIYWSPVIGGDVAQFELRSSLRPGPDAVLILERVSHLP